MPPPFVPFTAMHGGAIAAGLVGVAALVLLGRSGEKNERIARFILAFLCLAAFAYTQAAFIAFFVHHFAVVGAALYLPLVMGWRADRPPALTARTSPSP